MKQLLLIRHAQAAHPMNVSDFDRPLTAKGLHDATELAKRLKAMKIKPELVVSSTALRAFTTATIVAEQLGLSDHMEHKPEIYEAKTKTLLQVINTLPDQYDLIALTGHNPGFSDIATYLTGKYVDLSTSGAILIGFDEISSWAEITKENGQMYWLYEPAD